MNVSTLKRQATTVLVLAGIVALVGPTSMAGAYSQYTNLVWADEFNSTSLDTSKWAYDIGGGGWGNGELQTYTSNTNNVGVANGMLTLQALYGSQTTTTTRGKKIRTTTTSGYTSGKIKTLGKFNWQYGRVDVRAQLPTGVGSWPAIWMLPSGAKYGSQYLANGEIDIMEEVGADQNEIVGSAHSLAYNPSLGTTRNGVYYVPTANTAFHTYSLEWNPEYLSYQVDGIEFYRVANDHTGYQSWPYDQPFYLILNLAVGGSWGGYKGVDTASMPWRFNIDYVRVYQ
jgi:beta-glucanase (GH16 family)